MMRRSECMHCVMGSASHRPTSHSNNLEGQKQRKFLRRAMLGFTERAGTLGPAVAVEFLTGDHGQSAAAQRVEYFC